MGGAARAPKGRRRPERATGRPVPVEVPILVFNWTWSHLALVSMASASHAGSDAFRNLKGICRCNDACRLTCSSCPLQLKHTVFYYVVNFDTIVILHYSHITKFLLIEIFIKILNILMPLLINSLCLMVTGWRMLYWTGRLINLILMPDYRGNKQTLPVMSGSLIVV